VAKTKNSSGGVDGLRERESKIAFKLEVEGLAEKHKHENWIMMYPGFRLRMKSSDCD
jgi:hypothetical protein